MFIPDLDLYPSGIPDLVSRIPDLTAAPKEKGEKEIVCPSFCGHKFRKIVNNFIF